MIELIFHAVTFTTIAAAALVGVILAKVWMPAFDRALGTARDRRSWAALWGLGLPGETMIMGIMVARYLDGGVWEAWLGLGILWMVMAGSAAATRKLSP